MMKSLLQLMDKIPHFDTSQSYGFISKFIHFVFIILFLPQIVFGFLLHILPKSIKSLGYMSHKALGVLLLWMLVIRVINLGVQSDRPKPIAVKYLRSYVPKLHSILYLSMLAMPISGWIMSSIADKPPYVPMIGEWVFPVPHHKSLGAFMHELHHIFAYITSAALSLHLLHFIVMRFGKGVRIGSRMFKF